MFGSRKVGGASVHDRLVGQAFNHFSQLEACGGIQLRQEDDDHVLLRVDVEGGVEETSPRVAIHRSNLSQVAGVPDHSEAEAES